MTFPNVSLFYTDILYNSPFITANVFGQISSGAMVLFFYEWECTPTMSPNIKDLLLIS